MKISIDVTPSFPEVILCKFHLSRIFRLNVALLRMNLLYFVIILRNFRYFPFPIVLQRVLTTKNVTIHGVTLWLITIRLGGLVVGGSQLVPSLCTGHSCLYITHHASHHITASHPNNVFLQALSLLSLEIFDQTACFIWTYPQSSVVTFDIEYTN